jgi:hypothetical protein
MGPSVVRIGNEIAHRTVGDGESRRLRNQTEHFELPIPFCMLIVPQTDDLQVEAKVNPQDIDKLQVGQQTLLRLSAFNQRTTPLNVDKLISKPE